MREKPKFELDELVKFIDSNQLGIIKGLAFTHHEDMYRYAVAINDGTVRVETRENQLKKA